MKTHTVPIITNGPLCGEACPWLASKDAFPHCLLFSVSLAEKRTYDGDFPFRCGDCDHVTERAEALP